VLFLHRVFRFCGIAAEAGGGAGGLIFRVQWRQGLPGDVRLRAYRVDRLLIPRLKRFRRIGLKKWIFP
jgi:hypothetical protein